MLRMMVGYMAFSVTVYHLCPPQPDDSENWNNAWYGGDPYDESNAWYERQYDNAWYGGDPYDESNAWYGGDNAWYERNGPPRVNEHAD